MTGHWVYRLKDGSYLGQRRAPGRYADKKETIVLTLGEARVFNSPSAAANAGNYPGKYGMRGEPRGEAVKVRVILDRVEAPHSAL
jgi:hypothetical protein